MTIVECACQRRRRESATLSLIEETGKLVLFAMRTAWWIPRRPFRWSQLLRHLRDVGFGSLFIVVLTGFFAGLVFGFQTLQGFRRFGAEALVGPVTLLMLSRELGPVLTGLMVAGRSGSGIATELGTMKVTEQLDALSTLAVEPLQYLVVPRVLAATFMMPLLTSIFTGCGFLGCYLIGVGREGIDPGVLRRADFIDRLVPGLQRRRRRSRCRRGRDQSGGAQFGLDPCGHLRARRDPRPAHPRVHPF